MPAARESRAERALTALARALEPALGGVFAHGRIRAALHARALEAWRASDEPLIVCHGNINRSAFAARLAARREGANPASAGLYRTAERPSPPATIAAADARGVDLRAHRSAVLDGALARDARAIFIFDLDNLTRILLRHPTALRKTHFLGALSASGPVLIADPHGRPPQALEASFDAIERALAGADERG